MLARQRQGVILTVERDGGVRVSDLVTELGVSDMTVRRDIETLADKGLVHKVHGGATLADRSIDEPGFSVKSEMNPVQKSEIARTAASLIPPGTSVAVSAGTTAYAVAVELRAVKRLTVVTNSPRVAELLYDPSRDDQLVVMTGGVRTPSDALAGPVANAMLATTHVDTLILGVHGIDLQAWPDDAQFARSPDQPGVDTIGEEDHRGRRPQQMGRHRTLDDRHPGSGAHAGH